MKHFLPRNIQSTIDCNRPREINFILLLCTFVPCSVWGTKLKFPDKIKDSSYTSKSGFKGKFYFPQKLIFVNGFKSTLFNGTIS